MKRAILTLILAATVAVSAAQRLSPTQMERIITDASAAIESIECDFEQTKQMSMLDYAAVSWGKMYFVAKDKLRWQYTRPYNYQFVINAGRVAVRTAQSSNVIDAKSNRLFGQISRIILGGMDGSAVRSNDSFDVVLTDSGEQIVATLSPRAKQMKEMFAQIELHFDRRKGSVNRIVLHEAGGDQTTIKLLNVKINSDIDETLFAID